MEILIVIGLIFAALLVASFIVIRSERAKKRNKKEFMKGMGRKREDDYLDEHKDG